MRRSARAVLLAAFLAGAWGCEQDRTKEHEGYVSARTVLAGAAARAGGDARCAEEPACGLALAALEAIPPDSLDHAEAARLLAAVREARTRRPKGEASALAVQRGDAAGAEQPGGVAAPEGSVAAAPAARGPVAKKNYRDDDDWGLSVVGAPDLGGEADDSPPPPRARVLPAPPAGPPRLTCAQLQAKIQERANVLQGEFNARVFHRRQKELDDHRNGVYLSPNDSNSFDLSEVTKELSSLESDGTKNEGRFDDPELRGLRDQLQDCPPP